MIAEIKKYIDDHTCEITFVNEITHIFKIDKNVLAEQFKIIYNKSSKAYILDKKIEKLIHLLNESGNREISYYYAYELGFETSGGLCNLIKRRTGLTFEEFRNRVLIKD